MAGVPPKRGEAYVLFFGVTSQADTDIFQANPTIAAGDFQVSKDAGVTFANPATIPAVTAGNNKVIETSLAVAEMTPTTGDKILLAGSDQAGDEWQDIFFELTVTDTPTGEIAANAWAHTPRTLTQSAAEIAAAVAGDDLAIQRGDTWVAAITGLGDISDRDKLWFTAKTARTGADTAAIIQILLTEPVDSDDGLQWLNGEATTKTWGSIVVDDEVAGNITLALEPEAATSLAVISGKHYYDIQVLRSTGAVNTLSEGELSVNADITRAIS